LDVCESKILVYEGVEAMSSHILLAILTGIALSTPAWAHDPEEAAINTDIQAIFLHPAADIEAILLDPAEAPIDTEMKILWLEHIEARLRENAAAERSGLADQAAAHTGPTVLEHRPAPTNANLAAN
jgi:hypothetical protein